MWRGITSILNHCCKCGGQSSGKVPGIRGSNLLQRKPTTWHCSNKDIPPPPPKKCLDSSLCGSPPKNPEKREKITQDICYTGLSGRNYLCNSGASTFCEHTNFTQELSGNSFSNCTHICYTKEVFRNYLCNHFGPLSTKETVSHNYSR